MALFSCLFGKGGALEDLFSRPVHGKEWPLVEVAGTDWMMERVKDAAGIHLATFKEKEAVPAAMEDAEVDEMVPDEGWVPSPTEWEKIRSSGQVT